MQCWIHITKVIYFKLSKIKVLNVEYIYIYHKPINGEMLSMIRVFDGWIYKYEGNG
jgi:hypothetical protein